MATSKSSSRTPPHGANTSNDLLHAENLRLKAILRRNLRREDATIGLMRAAEAASMGVGAGFGMDVSPPLPPSQSQSQSQDVVDASSSSSSSAVTTRETPSHFSSGTSPTETVSHERGARDKYDHNPFRSSADSLHSLGSSSGSGSVASQASVTDSLSLASCSSSSPAPRKQISTLECALSHTEKKLEAAEYRKKQLEKALVEANNRTILSKDAATNLVIKVKETQNALHSTEAELAATLPLRLQLNSLKQKTTTLQVDCVALWARNRGLDEANQSLLTALNASKESATNYLNQLVRLSVSMSACVFFSRVHSYLPPTTLSSFLP